MEGIVEFFREYIMQYSIFADGSYYSQLWSRYYNVVGFFLGAALVILIYFAGAGENKKSGFFRSLAIIALLNSLAGIYGTVASALGSGQMAESYYYLFDLAANPIAGTILALVVYSCYKGHLPQVFCFGLATYGVTLLMFNVFVNARSAELALFLVARAAILGLICMWMTKLKNFYTSFIVFTSFFLISKFIGQFVIHIAFIDEIGRVFSQEFVFDALRTLIPDGIILGVVLTISIVYEKAVLTVKKPATAT